MAQVLRHLPPQRHPDLLVGTDTYDDAGVFRISDDVALVQTTDFFPPLVDDPFAFGRIAAANALSDIYAMGGVPLTALNLVGWPDQQLPYEVLADILRGGADACAEAGCVIVGGHSVRDREVKYGMAVTGKVHPKRIVTNASAKPGDKLVLTKPLGTGVLCSAAKGGKLPQADLAEAIAVMSALNKGGCDAALAVGVNSMTDITGFGLVGHAYEMAAGSDVTIMLHAAAVPLMARVMEMAEQGVITRAAHAARKFLGPKLLIDNVDETLADVLCDAQTSGGLLISVPAERCDALVAELKARGAICAAVVGEVKTPAKARVELVG
jgi:selenide, water dikinase